MASTILWADDEIDLLKPHIMFLKGKGYDVVTACSGADALELVAGQDFDLIILDENMPGLTGLETLQRIKLTAPHIPVIMITKSEEENIMDQAVGNKIADYLIKPVNPKQILLSIKKNLHSEQLVSSQTAATTVRSSQRYRQTSIQPQLWLTGWNSTGFLSIGKCSSLLLKHRWMSCSTCSERMPVRLLLNS